MPLIAQNHLELIIEFGLLILLAVSFFINLVPLSLSAVLLGGLIISVAMTLLFGFDAISLLAPSLGVHEFTHPYGAIALLGVATSLGAIYIMDDVGINTRSLKTFVLLLIVAIALAGGMVHRDFLMMWIVGLFIAFFILSKSFRRKSVLTVKRGLMVMVVVLIAFGFMEAISRILNMPIISPVSRIERILDNSLPSIKMVLHNTYLIGHNPTTSFWGSESSGFADGYISLPISLITTFGLPLPIFYGVLTNQKDVIDYFTSGIFAFGYEFGYLILFLVLIWVLVVLIIGLKILKDYKEKREKGNKTLLGREALLIGSLTAFIAQAWVGFFIINRDINGSAMVTFLFLSAMVVGHVLMIKKN
ncbi:MAG TPA: hypothetical protein VMC48_01130 [Methanobacterium sp.]|nr:hypothetical protein [Methanobacterium sp.]